MSGGCSNLVCLTKYLVFIDVRAATSSSILVSLLEVSSSSLVSNSDSQFCEGKGGICLKGCCEGKGGICLKGCCEGKGGIFLKGCCEGKGGICLKGCSNISLKEVISSSAFELTLPVSFWGVHPLFHVSLLWKHQPDGIND
ncbi:uncharacterized protein VP01_99g11 [Puccinia sorghi]|uniref:Uncharacterized protein n=1 Tax=Puccinia sorghi TaxID=27349 RepID=A0A0L6U5P7_9BASI|nr:uncharacterized protein VP01_99g11 [Puccinia sorghi]